MKEVDKLALKILDRRVEQIPDGMPMFRGIFIDKFDRESLIKICMLFANEWNKAQQDYFSALKRII